MKKLEVIAKEQIVKHYIRNYTDYGCTDIKIEFISEPSIDKDEAIYVNDNHLSYYVKCDFKVICTQDGIVEHDDFNGFSVVVPVGFKTPKGYFSKKKLPVSFNYQNEEILTESQALELLEFETDAKKNTFDPFYKENQAKARNAAAWNYVVQNYITDPYCTR